MGEKRKEEGRKEGRKKEGMKREGRKEGVVIKSVEKRSSRRVDLLFSLSAEPGTPSFSPLSLPLPFPSSSPSLPPTPHSSSPKGFEEHSPSPNGFEECSPNGFEEYLFSFRTISTKKE